MREKSLEQNPEEYQYLKNQKKKKKKRKATKNSNPGYAEMQDSWENWY